MKVASKRISVTNHRVQSFKSRPSVASLSKTTVAKKSISATRPRTFASVTKVKSTKVTPEVSKQLTIRRDFATESVTKKNRPISPHITIYKWPLPAITSITHRITGIALFAGFSATAIMGLTSDPQAILHTLDVVKDHSFLLPVVKGTISFPIIYHWACGLRHLYWEYTAKGLETPEMDKSSQALVGAVCIATLGMILI